MVTRCGPFDKIYFSSYLKPNYSYYKVSLKIGGFSVLCSLELIWVKKWKKLGEFWNLQGISFPMNTKLSLFCSKIAEKLEFKDTYSLRKEKKAKIWATSHKLFICFQDCMDFKNSPETFSGIFYQMDHIWWAPSRLKKSPNLKMKSH